MNPEEFKRRTKELGLAVIKLVDSLPRRGSAQTIGTQLLRAATSVGANYRAACRSGASDPGNTDLRYVSGYVRNCQSGDLARSEGRNLPRS